MAGTGSPPLVGASALLSLLPPPRKRAAMPRAAVSASASASASARAKACSYQLREGQFRRFHRLPSGLAIEVIFQEAQAAAAEGLRNPPLVFIHGSFHAAWCWVEHWLPFFSDSGYDCYALSLLGQGESDVPSGAAAGTLQNLVAHPLVAGAVLVCSVPPTGNSGLVWRYLLTKPIAAIKVTLSLAAKAFANSLPLCKETFFSSTMEDHLVLKYQELMKASSKLPLFDLRKLNASLPVSPPTKGTVTLLIMGASDDFIIDTEGLQETARFYGVQAFCVEGVAHDMMLDSRWEKGAQTFLSWLQELQRDQVS
ncbi:Alpha beta hydrolase [Musa troglodytarum]|uniref:Alpha beta hydrolase n=1 Tax=Musa troglodytarum TaxID=320322 RepID=A0A9E7KNX9_9LILI|nr:Alpha beta hydrolase [Musa troglodytarum]